MPQNETLTAPRVHIVHNKLIIMNYKAGVKLGPFHVTNHCLTESCFSAQSSAHSRVKMKKRSSMKEENRPQWKDEKKR